MSAFSAHSLPHQLQDFVSAWSSVLASRGDSQWSRNRPFIILEYEVGCASECINVSISYWKIQEPPYLIILLPYFALPPLILVVMRRDGLDGVFGETAKLRRIRTSDAVY